MRREPVGVGRWSLRTLAWWLLLGLLAASATGCAGTEPLAVEPVGEPSTVPTSGQDRGAATAAPDGSVTVAYAGVPSAWIVPRGDDVAARDLAAVWGVDLYRLDPHGQLRPGLVRDAEVTEDAGGTRVRLELASGTWSDGTPVTSADVVATLELLRSGPQDQVLATLAAIEAPTPDTVVLRFTGPYERWPWLLASTGSVLPAHVLDDGGLEALSADLDVTGGWYRLVAHEPGRSASFEAHTDGPLGAPGLARIEILFTPSYETALGLLADGTVDVVAGYLALNPEGRARALDGVAAGAPVGGTWFGIQWRPDGELGDDPRGRRAVAGAVHLDALIEGLLGPRGAPATSPVPGVRGDFTRASAGDPPDISISVPGTQELPAFTARALQRDVVAAGGGLELVRLDPPRFVERSRVAQDGALTEHRDPPQPSVVPYAGPDLLDVALRVDAVGPLDAPAEFQQLAGAARVLPLYRAAVAHAWTEELVGVRPSSWPGIGFWNVGEWRFGGAGDGD